jgi:hypothetical protein
MTVAGVVENIVCKPSELTKIEPGTATSKLTHSW